MGVRGEGVSGFWWSWTERCKLSELPLLSGTRLPLQTVSSGTLRG